MAWIVLREFLYALTFVGLGLVVVPLILSLIIAGSVKAVGDFYRMLIAMSEFTILLWSIVISPYVVFLLLRGLVRAAQHLRHK